MTYSYPFDPNQSPPQHPYNASGDYGPGLPKRPVVVTIAGAITVLHVVLHVAMGALTSLAVTSDGGDVATSVIVLVFSFAIGLGFLFLAIGVFRGLQAARIASIVCYGLFTGLCCVFNGLILTESLTGAAGLDEGSVVISVMSIVAMASYFVVVILMIVPASRDWFKEVSQMRRQQRFSY